MKLKITSADTDQRLDVWLAKKLSLSRSQAQKLIKAGDITVNDRPVSAHLKIKEGDLIKAENKKKTADRPVAKAKKDLLPLDIIDETYDYLIINKPAGLIMHDAGQKAADGLAEILINRYPKIAKVGDDPVRPGIVHRLDRDASGLVAIAKTQAFFEHLKTQFQARTIEKKYTALVYGKINKDKGEIDFLLERATSGHRMAAKPKSQTGKTAVSEFEVTGRFINYTLVRVKTKTGRTHQVRVHLSAYGYPIVGDDLYGTRLAKEKNKKTGCRRIFLVADELAFTDLAGTRKYYKISLPDEFETMLANIK